MGSFGGLTVVYMVGRLVEDTRSHRRGTSEILGFLGSLCLAVTPPKTGTTEQATGRPTGTATAATSGATSTTSRPTSRMTERLD